MLYKNKIKVQNILKSAVALMLILTLSLSTALSPLAKAEEARWTMKTLTSVSFGYNVDHIYVSPDGSKLFILGLDNANGVMNFWMSADDGATWRKIFSKQTGALYDVSVNIGESKIALRHENSFSISTDGGQSWVERRLDPGQWSTYGAVHISPDGSFLVSCSINGTGDEYATHISTDDGQTWTQTGTNSIECPQYVFNNGTLILQNGSGIMRSTDYGQTWTETPNVLNADNNASFSNNGNNVFDGDRISLDGGNHWTPSNAPIPAGYTVYHVGISDDGKNLFVNTRDNRPNASGTSSKLLASVDGGRTWHSKDDDIGHYDNVVMSSNGSKLFGAFYKGLHDFRVGTLTTSQPVTPGSGAGGAATPSTGSTSATPNQKPGKASGRLAETGTSTWTVGGLAVVVVAAGALVLRKRL